MRRASAEEDSATNLTNPTNNAAFVDIGLF